MKRYPKHVEIALADLHAGVAEIPGAEHHPRILEYHDHTSLDAADDETPYCAAAVNCWLAEAGHAGTRSAAARSFLNYGKAVSSPRVGDIVVFWRGSVDGRMGHVGLYMGEDESGQIRVLGANQNNAVNISLYPKSWLLGYRRISTPINSKTVAAGSLTMAAGAAGLLDAERRLHRQRYRR